MFPGRRIRDLVVLTTILLIGGCSDDPVAVADDCSVVRETLTPGKALAWETGGPDVVICVSGPAEGTYAALLFVAAGPNSILPFDIVLSASGIRSLGASSDPGSPGTVPPRLQRAEFEGGSMGDSRVLLDDDFHWDLLERGRELGAAGSPAVGSRPSPGAAGALPRVPTVGDVMELGVSGSCDETDVRTGRVVTVSARAIVLVDEENPPSEAWTVSELEELTSDFDQLVYPVVTGSFGALTDVDANERVILFFSRGVNERSVGGRGIVAGFFWNGDLFAREDCASSNEAEVLYLAVPDPLGEVGAPVDGAMLREVAPSVVGHELQHLVNAGRRLSGAATSFEETWLNEALSQVAEELLFYAATDLAPRTNLSVAELLGGGRTEEEFDRFGRANVGRYNLFIQAPRFHSAFGRDALETRGAAWAFLRYVLDRDPATDTDLLRRLTVGPATGLANLSAALGADPLDWMTDWSTSILLDDGGGAGAHVQPSWDFRSLIPALRADEEFPIELLALDQRGLLLRLGAGNAGYAVFEAVGTEPLRVRFSPEDLEGPRTLRASLVRID